VQAKVRGGIYLFETLAFKIGKHCWIQLIYKTLFKHSRRVDS